jgi:putative transposase
MPLVRLPRRVWPHDNGLQSLRALGETRSVGKDVSGVVTSGSLDRHVNDRLHSHQGASLGIRRKRGEQNQAIGRARGGRNTKIHAIADARGRFISLKLTDGSAHDCPVAQPLISSGNVAKRLLGDKAYDSKELRLWLRRRGTKCVIPNRSNRKQPFSFSKKAYRERHRVKNAFCRLKDFRRIVTRYDRLARNYLASVYFVATIAWWIL